MTEESIVEYLPPGTPHAGGEGSREVAAGRWVGAALGVTGGVGRLDATSLDAGEGEA
jgi:hypothetical protein